MEPANKEDEKAEEEKVDEKEYLPSFNLLDPGKTGSVPIEAVNDLLVKLESIGSIIHVSFRSAGS